MRRFLQAALVLLSVLSATQAATPPPQDRLIGRWRSVQPSPAGVSAVFDFRADGQVEVSSVAISERNYRVLGTDTIVFHSSQGEEKRELEWEGQDRARIDDETAGKTNEMTRIGRIADRANPLVGEWNSTGDWNDTQFPARATFTRDGRVTWITILRADQGHYSTQGKTIRLEIPGRPVVEGNFAVTGDRLTLPNPRGGEATFQRF